MASMENLPDQQDASPTPDIMNDPAYATNTRARTKSLDEQDTCRICRGEGSAEEPLFYPCKCSGSIKFVHQDCLMEWLSHSQKKHCELCKTPFRFTKLYHPQMPQTLPTPIFLRELVFHGLRAVVTWLRFLLVAFVWLGWLPWSMRSVWRGLFWAADGTWSVRTGPWNQTWGRGIASAEGRLVELAENGTTPLPNPFLPTTDASVRLYVVNLVKSLRLTAFSQIMKYVAMRPINGTSASNDESNLHSNLTAASSQWRRSPSWLSDVSFLQDLTPYQTFNNVLVDTLEGLLITLLVVVAFILVFLIREWVVQQQPVVNMAAEAEREERPVQRLDEAGIREIAQLHAQLRADRQRQEALNPGPAPTDANTNNGGQDGVIANRPIAIPRGRLHRAPSQKLTSSSRQDSHHRPDSPDQENSSTRESPITPNLSIVDADMVQKTLREARQAPGKQEWPGINVFMRLWRRSGSDPDEVLRIIEREGREVELEWIVLAMKRIKNRNAPVNDQSSRPTSSSQTSRDELDEPVKPFDQDIAEDDELMALRLQDEMFSDSSDTSKLKDEEDQYEVPKDFLWKPFDPERITNFDNMGRWPPNQALKLDSLASQSASMDIDDSSTVPALFTLSSQDSNTSDKGKGVDQSLIEMEPTKKEDPLAQRMNAAIDETDTAEQTVNSYMGNQSPEETPQPTSLESEQTSDTSMEVNLPSFEIGAEPKRSLYDIIGQWLWTLDASPTESFPAQTEDGADDEHIVRNLADEAPFVAVAQNQLARLDHVEVANPIQEIAEELRQDAPDGDVELNPDQAAVDPDPEAVEDAEDLEGIMELIGMQGPIFGLLQNGVFSALLITITVATAIWLPYVWGKVALLLLANPVTLFVKLPLRTISLVADTLFDLALFMSGSMIYWVNGGLHLLFAFVGRFAPPVNKLAKNTAVATASRSIAETSLQRLAKVLLGSAFRFSDSDFAAFSILSHQSLEMFQNSFFVSIELLMQILSLVFYETPLRLMGHGDKITSHHAYLGRTFMNAVIFTVKGLQSFMKDLPTFVSSRRWMTITLQDPAGVKPLNYEMAHWNTKDRILTVILGYLFFTSCGIIYLRLASFMPGNRRGQRFEGIVADSLNQAGGVMKVILIIGIEMIVFPLYCGLLLDAALLPLFENVSLISRVNFTLESPCTSLFVHWFIGTCYMFHFALFVSMCRKIMRSGVLYFIRDPDDPTFHPVRDVLERNISTQLRKIAFSALVYGALVIICLGGVVWGLAYAFDGVLPIHWSSNEPVLEFPVDLLFYNFLMPLAVRFIRPSDGLHIMYDWWFHKCARFLRISEFLFGERQEDEEGRHVRRTWRDAFSGKRGDVQRPVIGEDRRIMMDDRETDAYFLRDGRFVRTPASDQVRIPKGGRVFLEVDEHNDRIDGELDRDDGLHGRSNDMFKKVYVPPYFKFRIGLLVLLIWLFAASTGIGVTIIPLVLGRKIFAYLLPSHLRMNDVYAFSIGVYVLGSLLYAAVHSRSFLMDLKTKLAPYTTSPRRALSRISTFSLRFVRFTYAFAGFAFLLPSLVAFLMELYFVIPLHTYFSALSTSESESNPPIIHFIQDWTLGVLYVRMIGRVITSFYPTSLPATALHNIIRNGWLDPDIALATRGFIFPSIVFTAVALLAPLGLGWVLTCLKVFEGIEQAKVYRYSYPGILALAAAVDGMFLFRRQVRIWRLRIRDEVYLIGERLHNFGEKRVKESKKGKGRSEIGRAGRVETH